MKDETMKILYRYDGCANFEGFVCTEYKILKETKCGYWIKYDNNYLVAHNGKAEKWVNKSGRKRFCYPTKLEAIYGLFYRRKRYAKILNARLSSNSVVLTVCENLIWELKK